MALTDYTFRLGDAGEVLNSDSTGFPFVDIIEVRGLDSAPFRETSRDHEGVDGGFMDAEFEKARPITLEGFVYAEPDSIETYLDKLKANYAPSRTLVPFYFSAEGESERLLYVKPLGVRYDWTAEDRRLGIARVQFNMFAEDPRIYAPTEQSVTVMLAALATDGFAFPLGFPFSFGSTIEITNSASLTNSGNRPTPVEFIISGPVVDPELINQTTGKSLKFVTELSTTETLVVNTHYRTARLNGTINRRGSLQEPNWFDLDPGTTLIRYLAESSITDIFDETPLNNNPFFETNVSSWTVSGGTLAQSLVDKHEGLASALLTPDGVTANAEARSEQQTVFPNFTYKAKAWVKCATSRNVYIAIDWFNSIGGTISQSSNTTAVTAATWTAIEVTATPPATAATGRVVIGMGSTPPGTDTLYIDEAKLIRNIVTEVLAKFRSAWR